MLDRAGSMLVAGAVILSPAAAFASPPMPSLSRSAPPWVGYIVMFILLALVMGVSLMPSKRGHQD